MIKLLSVVSALFVMGCGGAQNANVDAVINDTGTFTLFNEDACFNAYLEGNARTTSECGGTLRETITIEEETGYCKAVNVEVTYVISLQDSVTHSTTLKVKELAPGKSTQEQFTIEISNVFLYQNDQVEDIEFESECPGSLTGLEQSPI